MSTKEQSRIAVDPLILTIQNGSLMVYLQKREEPPFKNMYEIPGGLLQENETAKETLKRKLSVVATKEILFFQFHTFTNPDRDPRDRVVSIGYIALVPPHYVQDSKGWFSLQNLPDLAFDHKQIIDRGLKHIKKNLNEIIAKQFLPEKFPLNALQEVYEILLDEKFDNRNFRRKMISSRIVKETDELTQGVSHRPAKLFVLKG